MPKAVKYCVGFGLGGCATDAKQPIYKTTNPSAFGNSVFKDTMILAELSCLAEIIAEPPCGFPCQICRQCGDVCTFSFNVSLLEASISPVAWTVVFERRRSRSVTPQVTDRRTPQVNSVDHTDSGTPQVALFEQALGPGPKLLHN